MANTVPIGTLPPLGEIPERMTVQVIRQDRYGDPRTAIQIEEVEVPKIKPHEVLIAVMAAGVNYNNIWAAKGLPIDVIAMRQKKGDAHDFHIGGSDVSGIVYAIGNQVKNVAIGDKVVVHHGWWDADDPWVLSGKDPMLAPSAGIWGFDTNFGSFAQFCVAQSHAVLPKAPQLTWEEAAAPTLVGSTAYRMLFGWAGNECKAGDVVLVWGGSGGLGSQAIQLAVTRGARAVAVVSNQERGEYCLKLGAAGYINRLDFSHWGVAPHWTETEKQKVWTNNARAFGKAIWDVLGERRNPNIVFEHPGEATIPTSLFVCETGGMVVICAGTTGYTASFDLRYHWVRQKRLQGSHGTNDEHAAAYNQLVIQGKIDPCLGKVYSFEETGQAHYDMDQGKPGFGNRTILVGAGRAGLGRTE